ncbi:MAG: hypothetical protein HC884_07640 [Chloroflexaceae bacterium]|nr:hypothetical protein [Chloroflexaceae bacterium]
MKLPNYSQALIAESKITDYLLSLTHLRGQSKARFFLRFGFSPSAWQVLADALWQHAATHEVVQVEPTPIGTLYVIEGTLVAPDGRAPLIRTV